MKQPRSDKPLGVFWGLYDEAGPGFVPISEGRITLYDSQREATLTMKDNAWEGLRVVQVLVMEVKP